MKQLFLICAAIFCFFSFNVLGQIPTATLARIVKAEDARRYDAALENLLKNRDEKIRLRAALAAGRIGDERAVSALVNLLKDDSIEVQTTAMFALGETESPQAADAVAGVLNVPANSVLRARALEAAGKIAAANPKDAASSELGKAIVSALNYELSRSSAPDDKTILLGITAVLRARPEGGEAILIRLLSEPDARIRADALNTLARLRSKNINDRARELLQKDSDPIVRANAARLLGAAEDKTSFDLLLKSAINDADLRVRVSAIRALASLKDARAADALLSRAEKLLSGYASSKTFAVFPTEKNELLEIAATLGRILPNTNNERAIKFLNNFYKSDKYSSPEIAIALVRTSPVGFANASQSAGNLITSNWKVFSSFIQGYGEFSNLSDSEENKKIKEEAVKNLYYALDNGIEPKATGDFAKIEMAKAIPDLLRAYAAFKPGNLVDILQKCLLAKDETIRATAAELLGEQPVSKQNLEVLKTAFGKAFLTDKTYNDAQLAILDALFKLDKAEAIPTLFAATDSQDYLIRKKAFDLLKDASYKDSISVKTTLEQFAAKRKNHVLPYAGGSKLGVITNTNADYVRAVSRKNAKAIFTTPKGNFTIDFAPEDAPLTVDNFIKLAKSNYFNNVSIHRVVPNFVMQDGDPRGDGNGGPGWQIRDEINMLPYERGAVGMALSGKDTGGSQWFVTHSPQPHLDGGYTVFGRVSETDMKIVDNLVRGDKIFSVRIVEGNLSPRNTRRKPAR